MPRKMLSIVAASVALAVLVPATTASSATCYSYSDKERGFARKINRARSSRDIRKLSLDPELSRVAIRQTRTMVNKNLLHHPPNLGKRVTHWISLGENVGKGGTVASLHKMFMRSRPHKANILSREFRFVGVGAKRARGRLWVSVVFESRRNPGTTLDMPRC
ncbi:MAG: CAP domain-containing protein [Actinomycetota bacterium]|nr:CAP domain-containing protein [Actinomycetota bacterium]